MKKRTIKGATLILAIISLSFGCTKPLPCETNSTGTLKVVSTKIDPYFTYVNEIYVGNAEPATFTEFESLPTGVFEVLFINKNDNDEAYEGTISIESCQESPVNL